TSHTRGEFRCPSSRTNCVVASARRRPDSSGATFPDKIRCGCAVCRCGVPIHWSSSRPSSPAGSSPSAHTGRSSPAPRGQVPMLDTLTPTQIPHLLGPGGRPLRVAHLTTVDMSLQLLLGTELRADVEAGLEVFGLSAPGPWVSDVEKLGVTHVPLPSLTRSWSLRQDAAAGRELLRELRRLKLDVLHTHNPKTGVLGRVLGRAARIPVVVNTCHGLWLRPGDGLGRRAFVLGTESIAARASHFELYQNADDRQTLRRVVPTRRSQVVGNGIDLHRF